MLLQLNISNFALIENLTISFDKGFNVFSGETGAGKSILIDAISYVLGGKFNKELIRTGEDKTFVEAIFTIENENTKTVLNELEIDYDDIVIISRETFQSGKSITKVNNKSVIIANLKLITATLIDIHGQHENQNLLDSANHINYLDTFSGNEIDEALIIYKEKYKELKEIDNKINHLQGDNSDRDKLMDFLKFQIEEINSARLNVNEEDELQSKYEVLSNAEKINNALNQCYNVLYEGDDNSSSVHDALGSVLKDLKSVENHIEKLRDITSSLQDIYYILEERIEEIRQIKDSIYYDENELEYINNRIYQIGNYKKKYGKTIKDILDYRDKIQNQYDEMINRTEIIEKLSIQKSKIVKELKDYGKVLHNIRSRYSEELAIRVKNELQYIGMGKSVFKISVDAVEDFSINGCDKVQFLISTNPGEPLKPLEKIVSGGELSRVMLALKVVFVNKDKIPTVIFDEIDTGISGRVAQSVGEKMYQVSSKHQVLCVTHLPQIACMSDTHYVVLKEVKDNKTYTNVIKTDTVQKEYEIARMIGGADVTKLTLESTRELIKISENKKFVLK